MFRFRCSFFRCSLEKGFGVRRSPRPEKLVNAAQTAGDKYLVIHDFPSFVEAQAKVDATYADKAKWCKLSIQVGSHGRVDKSLKVKKGSQRYFPDFDRFQVI